MLHIASITNTDYCQISNKLATQTEAKVRAMSSPPALVLAFLIINSKVEEGFSEFTGILDILSVTETSSFPLQAPVHSLEPALQFRFDGNITQLIYVASQAPLIPSAEYFEIWREDGVGSNFYRAISPSSPDLNRGSEIRLASTRSNDTIYSLEVRNFSVQKNDILGFASLLAPVSLRVLDLGDDVGPDSYYFLTPPGRILIGVNVSSAPVQRRFVPLITAVVVPSPVSVTSAINSLSTINFTETPAADVTNMNTAAAAAASNTFQVFAIIAVAGVEAVVIIVMMFVFVCVTCISRRKKSNTSTDMQSPSYDTCVLPSNRRTAISESLVYNTAYGRNSYPQNGLKQKPEVTYDEPHHHHTIYNEYETVTAL